MRNLVQDALVISQGWPSWTFALDGLGFASISTIASFRSLSSREEFKHTSLGSTLIPHDSWTDWVNSHLDTGVVFVQGNREFLESIFLQCESFHSLRLVYCCSDPNFWTADGWRENHRDAGGVTNGAWTFYKQNLTMSAAVPSIQRSLRHVLRTTEGGSSTRALSKCQSPLSSADSYVCWGDKFPGVETYSVFTPDALVQRLVTEEELLDVYDLELSVQAELKSF